MELKKRIKIAIAVVLIAFIGFIYLDFFATVSSEKVEKVVVEIPRGLGLRGIALKLEEAGIIRSGKLFILSVLVKGAKSKLKAGEYEFQIGDPLDRIIEKLIKGDVVVRKITIPEGFTINEISELLEKSNIMPREAFLEKAYSSEFTKELLGISLPSFEGYLFPDSYSYTKGITPEELIQMMVSRFKEIYEPLRTKGKVLGLTDHEIVTLASIIEKETGDVSERPLISAVFHNRLRVGMRLESDPTVIYGMSDFDGNLTKRNLRTETEYNTYMFFGLPPGPIASPGKDSLRAALNPANVNYLYFVSRGNGTHEFSSSYIEHQKAIIRYQSRGVLQYVPTGKKCR